VNIDPVSSLEVDPSGFALRAAATARDAFIRESIE
jgi:hypothetical protein